MTIRHSLAAFAAMSLIAGPALAQPVQTDDSPRQIAVSYADLKLDTASGQAVLVERIHRAAEAACGGEPDSRDVKAMMAYRACTKHSVETAVAAIPSTSQLAQITKPAG